MSRFGQLSYGQKERQFIGQPVEDIAKTNAALIDRYHMNRDLIDELQIMESNVDLIDNEHDKAIWRDQMDSTNAALKQVSESGAYEHFGTGVRNIYKNFRTNKGLQIAMSSRQQQIEAYEKIDAMEGLSPKYKGIAKQKSMWNYQGTREDPETGEWTGGFTAYIPAEPVDLTKLTDEILKGINANKESGSGWDLASAEANAAVELYIKNYSESIESIDESRVGHIVENYLLNNPEATAWIESKAEMDYFNNFTRHDITPTEKDIESRLFSNYQYRQKAGSTKPKTGETDERGVPNDTFYERVRKDYLEEVKTFSEAMIQNTISDFEEQNVDYENDDIMEHIYKKALIQETVQSQMDILSSKYGFTKIDTSTDIKLNEYSRRLYDEQGKYHAQVLAGPDVPIRPRELLQNRRELENNITSTQRQLDQLKYNLSTATEASDIENYNIEIRQAENHLRNLNTRRDDLDRDLSNSLKDIKPEDIISEGMTNVLHSRSKAGVIDNNDITYIRESLLEGRNVEDVIEHLGEKSKFGSTGLGWKGLFFNSDMSVKDMNDYAQNLGNIAGKLEQRLFTLIGLYNTTQSEEILHQLNTDLFRGLYEESLDQFNTALDNLEPVRHRGTFSIFTAGHPGLEANEQFLIKGIKDGNINLTDLLTGTTFQFEETKEAIDNADEISISFGGVVDSDYNYPVFHVTARYKGEPNKHYVASIQDLDNNLLDTYIEGLRDIKHGTKSRVTRHTLDNYINMMEGHMVPIETYGNIGSAIDQKNIHNMKSGDTNTISTGIGDLFIRRHADDSYTVTLSREGRETINLAGEGNYFQNIEDMYAPFGNLHHDIRIRLNTPRE